MKEVNEGNYHEVFEAFLTRVEDLRWDMDTDAFWRFEADHADEPLGKDGLDVRGECVRMLNLCADTVAKYDCVLKDVERESYRAVERMLCGTFSRNIDRFSSTLNKAFKKALWLNRECKTATGRFFFRGMLERDADGDFAPETAFALVYLCFTMIDG